MCSIALSPERAMPARTIGHGNRSNCISFGLLVILVQLSAAAQFEPYTLNGGLVSAVAGKDFSIIATDTRMIGEGGYVIDSRSYLSNRLWSIDDDMMMFDIEDSLRSSPDPDEVRKFDLENTPLSQTPVFIGSSGCSTDCCQLQRTVRADFRAASYFGQISRFDPTSVANLLSQTLYERRGFPYYSFCVVSGLGWKGGESYVYDAIGSYERVAVSVAGTGREILQPILDRMFQARCENNKQVDGTADEAVETLCKAYRSVSEREIGVGDNLLLHISKIQPNGDVNRCVFVVPLKQH